MDPINSSLNSSLNLSINPIVGITADYILPAVHEGALDTEAKFSSRGVYKIALPMGPAAVNALRRLVVTGLLVPCKSLFLYSIKTRGINECLYCGDGACEPKIACCMYPGSAPHMELSNIYLCKTCAYFLTVPRVAVYASQDNETFADAIMYLMVALESGEIAISANFRHAYQTFISDSPLGSGGSITAPIDVVIEGETMRYPVRQNTITKITFIHKGVVIRSVCKPNTTREDAPHTTEYEAIRGLREMLGNVGLGDFAKCPRLSLPFVKK